MLASRTIVFRNMKNGKRKTFAKDVRREANIDLEFSNESLIFFNGNKLLRLPLFTFSFSCAFPLRRPLFVVAWKSRSARNLLSTYRPRTIQQCIQFVSVGPSFHIHSLSVLRVQHVAIHTKCICTLCQFHSNSFHQLFTSRFDSNQSFLAGSRRSICVTWLTCRGLFIRLHITSDTFNERQTLQNIRND